MTWFLCHLLDSSVGSHFRACPAGMCSTVLWVLSPLPFDSGQELRGGAAFLVRDVSGCQTIYSYFVLGSRNQE